MDSAGRRWYLTRLEGVETKGRRVGARLSEDEPGKTRLTGISALLLRNSTTHFPLSSVRRKKGQFNNELSRPNRGKPKKGISYESLAIGNLIPLN